MKDVQCYELFGGIAHKNHAFSFFHFFKIPINFEWQILHYSTSQIDDEFFFKKVPTYNNSSLHTTYADNKQKLNWSKL